MNTEKFWSMIESTRQQSGQNIDKQIEILIEDLTHLSVEDIEAFDRILWNMMARAYRADLWEAASLVECGCSDDGFYGFRGWLIAQGQTIYERVLNDPDDLSDIVAKEHRFKIEDERIPGVAADAYERKTGQVIPKSGYWPDYQLVGGSLLPKSEIPAKFPRITAKLGIFDNDSCW